jgi:TRAP-type C4-dicarboxylate transport system permease small subunit
MQIVRALDSLVERSLRWSVIGCVVGCLLILALGVIGRVFTVLNQSASPEFTEILFTWGTFLGTAMLWRERALLRVDFVLHMLPPAPAWGLKIIIELGMLSFAMLMIYYGWDFATAIVEYTPFLQVNKVYWYLSIPVSGTIMAAYSLGALYELLRSPLAGAVEDGKQQDII